MVAKAFFSIYKHLNITENIGTNNTRHQHNKEAQQQHMAAVRYIRYLLLIAFAKKQFLRMQ